MVISFELDKQAKKNFAELRQFFKTDSNLDIIRRSLNLLNIAKDVIESDGKLIAKKDNAEREILVTK